MNHPGVRSVWLQWAKGSLDPVIPDPVSIIDSGSGSGTSGGDLPSASVAQLGIDYNGNNDGNYGEEKDMNEALRDFRHHNGVPLSVSDPLRGSLGGTDHTGIIFQSLYAFLLILP